jgi:hypothetical protein
MGSHVVELGSQVWLADIEGDPGRTLVLRNARRYATEHGARTALGIARSRYPDRGFARARVVPIEDGEWYACCRNVARVLDGQRGMHLIGIGALVGDATRQEPAIGRCGSGRAVRINHCPWCGTAVLGERR